MENLLQFVIILLSAIIIGFTANILVVKWVFTYKEGLDWDGGLAEFNWHPVLIVTGFIFLQGMAIIIYRIPWTWQFNKLTMKFVHAGLHLVAFISVIIALVAVFDFHNTAEIPNMYSLHSWLGIAAVLLFSVQLVAGTCVYLIPGVPVSWRATLMPFHVYTGLFIFACVIAVTLMGITEKLIFGLKNPKYKDSPPEAIFVNVLGVLVVVFGGLIFWIVSRPLWKRPSEETLHALHSNEKNLSNTDGQVLPEMTEKDVRRRINTMDN